MKAGETQLSAALRKGEETFGEKDWGFFLLPPGCQGLFTVHKKKFMKQRHAESAASTPKVFFALCTSGKLHHTEIPQ